MSPIRTKHVSVDINLCHIIKVEEKQKILLYFDNCPIIVAKNRI